MGGNSDQRGAARGQEGLGKKARTGKSDMRRVGGRDASWNKEREDNIGQNWTKACVSAIVQFLHWTELDIKYAIVQFVQKF